MRSGAANNIVGGGGGRGFNSSTSHISLSRSCHCNSLIPPNVSLKNSSRQAER
jgi:hypothetical protein